MFAQGFVKGEGNLGYEDLLFLFGVYPNSRSWSLNNSIWFWYMLIVMKSLVCTPKLYVNFIVIRFVYNVET